MAPQARIATNFFLLPSEIILGAQTVAPGPMNVSYRSAFRTAAAQIIVRHRAGQCAQAHYPPVERTGSAPLFPGRP